ncbi:MAG TPA: hypothetical protein VM571_02660, partial [Noviherbaspirillum sp.]|nr:hypothetical protein [Noviherbaspirillum sp.]
MSLWDLPSSFRFAVRDTQQKDIVEVFKASNGRLQNSGRKVEVAPFAKENMDKIAQIIAQLRTKGRPAIEYITNQFVDIHRSSGKSHVVGAILTNEETLHDRFDLDMAAKQGLANKMANCDRANAASNRMMSLFDIKDPVLYYWTTEDDHNTCLVGDPRMPKYGEKNTVVVDSYPVFPMPHTLAEASFQVRIPREGEEGHADLEIWHPRDNAASRFDASDLPAPISDQQQRAWLEERGWPTDFGADVVKAWHDTELRETGEVPDRWEYLFSCKDPSVRYHTGHRDYTSHNKFPLEFVRQRTEAFLQLHKAYPEDSESQSLELELARASRRRVLYEPQNASSDIMPRPESEIYFEHVTPFHTQVKDVKTGELLMDMHGWQMPVGKINNGFFIKDPRHPDKPHHAYRSDTNV